MHDPILDIDVSYLILDHFLIILGSLVSCLHVYSLFFSFNVTKSDFLSSYPTPTLAKKKVRTHQVDTRSGSCSPSFLPSFLERVSKPLFPSFLIDRHLQARREAADP